jgi:OOP family OmpA-OmpF porin
VVGYTDNTGSDEYNRSLSEKRAKEIGRLIVVKFGVPASMIVAEGRGISNDYQDQRLNRRVEVYVYH